LVLLKNFTIPLLIIICINLYKTSYFKANAIIFLKNRTKNLEGA